MKNFQVFSKKTLLYNLIFFDFILLESSTQKISNFFIQKLETKYFNKGTKKISFLSIEEVTKSFKRFLRLLKFLKTQNTTHLLTILVNTPEIITLLKSFFKQFKLKNLFIRLSASGIVSPSSLYSTHSVIFLDFAFTQAAFLSCFFKNCFLIQAINPVEDGIHYSSYKILADLEDYKKIIFFILLISSIFKK